MGESCYTCRVSCIENLFFGTEGPLFDEAQTMAANEGLDMLASRSSSKAVSQGVKALGRRFFLPLTGAGLVEGIICTIECD